MRLIDSVICLCRLPYEIIYSILLSNQHTAFCMNIDHRNLGVFVQSMYIQYVAHCTLIGQKAVYIEQKTKWKYGQSN